MISPHGVIPPLTTPFTPAGDIYEDGLRRLVEFQIEKGVHGLFICGTYGSGPIMSLDERKRVHEIVIDQAKGRLVIIAHVGTTSTAQSVDLARHAEAAGADCVASVPPFYHHYDEREVLGFYQAMVSAVKVPVYVYNNPKASGFSITPAFLRRLADAGVQGVKDSGFGYIEFSHFVLALQDRPDFTLVVGTEGIALPAFMIGAKGCVSGLANAFPEIVVRLWDLFQAGRYAEANQLQLQVNRARQILHIPGSTNAACYAALHARGIDVGMPKLPIMPVPDDKAQAMLSGFKDMGLL